MKRRLVIITEIISPYRIPLFNSLARRPEVDLHVIFLAENDPDLRQWKVYKDEIQFPYQVLRSWRQRIGEKNVLWNLGMGRALRRANPDAILCGGYNYPAAWESLAWSLAHGVGFYLWSESHLGEMHRGRSPLELFKREFLQRCTGFVVPGQAARQYLLAQRANPRTIFTAVNAVDNELFATASARIRKNQESARKNSGLPTRYFLFVGRLVREKGVFELLEAYAKLCPSIREQIGLVFVGDGAATQELRSKAELFVQFTGFAQREQLPTYYALADALILPTHSDTWGLVVNEAMACGLPIIVSNAAGCASDLITDQWNGVIVPAKDVDALTSAMRLLASRPDVLTRMGTRSQERIRQFSAEAWSDGIAQMLDSISRAG
jgi:glycosyltransferase involved in cell wall biosynthesis